MKSALALLFIFSLSFLSISLNAQTNTEKARWEKHVQQTTIIRDEWGVPHIYGKTDADAVFGLMYAQCEENFPQIEKNYLEMLGRLAELKSNDISSLKKKDVIYADLMMQLIQDSVEAITDFERSPEWFKKLLIAHADGLNYYLAKHPEVHPEVITQFKPWYHLMWTDGSVSPTRTGGIKEPDVAAFYGGAKQSTSWNQNEIVSPFDMEEKTLKGSNGFAIAPKHSKNGNALLYINPHVPFYFRSEMHMVSEEGLNVYGAVTWGQMFIYQGFNEHCGWMHTSSYADVADVYLEKINKQGNGFVYEYEQKLLPVSTRTIHVKYIEEGAIKTSTFTTYKTHHGPVMGARDGQWLSLHENNRSLNALLECWNRTKAKSFADYNKALSLLANNSNNTVYADAEGNIAYWHGNFMPKRNNANYDYSRPVDGTIKATDWKGIHALNEIVQSINPINGWLQNCNATPFTVAGSASPKANQYPAYMAPDGENPRGINAVRLLAGVDKISLDDLIALGYNKHLTAFDILLNPFVVAAKKMQLTSQQEKAINYFENWNHEADTNSVAQTLAIEWATDLAKNIAPPSTEEEGTELVKKYERMNLLSNELKLKSLDNAITVLMNKYGSWEIKWGSINKYQRVNPGAIFNDMEPSISVAQTSSRWGQLPAFESRSITTAKGSTQKRYGFSGNSFVAAVSFGKKLEAKTIITGGQSRFDNNTHFTDQAQMYIEGNFKTIHFYKADVLAHKVISYKPGLER